MAKSGYTHITMVLDKSGSMSAILNDTLGGFNTFLKGQKETASPSDTFSLVQFDTKFSFTHKNASILNVPELTTQTFVPNGGTALVDTLGWAINDLGKYLAALDEPQRPEKIVFVILTDGEENSSWQFTKDQVNNLIRTQTDIYKWEFVYLGANQDAIQEAQKYGIRSSSAMNFVCDSAGVSSTYASATRVLNEYKTGMSASMEFTDADRTLALGGTQPTDFSVKSALVMPEAVVVPTISVTATANVPNVTIVTG